MIERVPSSKRYCLSLNVPRRIEYSTRSIERREEMVNVWKTGRTKQSERRDSGFSSGNFT